MKPSINAAVLQKLWPLTLAFLLFLFLSEAVYAQAMTVIGGNEKARECFTNATLAGSLERVSESFIEPCTYAMDYVDLSRRDLAATYTNRGILLYFTGSYTAALADYATALSISPNDAAIYINRGNVFFLSKEYPKALADYDKALELNATEHLHIAHLNRAMVYERTGASQLAEDNYRKALQYSPNWVLAQQRLENLLVEVAQAAKAAQQ